MTDLTKASKARERLLSDPDIYQVAVHPHLPDVTGCWLCTLLDAYAEAVRSDTLADVAARLPEALTATTPTKDHGQLCPVWVRRTEVLSNAPQSHAQRRGPIVCDCFVRRAAPLAAAAILAHLTGGNR